MPPLAKYTKEDIIEASLKLIQDSGVEQFSVRNISKILNCSTQPIYSNFSDSEALFEAVLIEIKNRLFQYTKQTYTDKVFRNIGLGFTYFARDFPNLFSVFFHQNEVNQKFIQQFLKDLRTELDKDQRFQKMSAKGKDALLEKMWIFTYGYADLIVKGIIKATTNQDVEKMVVGVGAIIIKDALIGG